MALVTPLLLAVVLGIVEIGRGMQVHAMVTNASREGARLGSRAGYSNDDVRQCVQEYLSACLGIAPALVNVNISIEPAAGNPAVANTLAASSKDLIIVNVDVPFDETSLTTGNYLNGTSLSARSVMRHE
jgi:Flp pilus assembly protein TadG